MTRILTSNYWLLQQTLHQEGTSEFSGQPGMRFLKGRFPRRKTVRTSRRLAVLITSIGVLFSTVGLQAAYQYYFNQDYAYCGGCVPQTNWWVNGSFYSHPDGTYIGQSTRASAISQVAVPDASSDYDIRIQVRAVPDGIAFLYLRATSNALAPNMPSGIPSPPGIGTFYSVQLEPDAGGTWAGISIRRQTESGNTLLGATTVACLNGSIHTLRAYIIQQHDWCLVRQYLSVCSDRHLHHFRQARLRFIQCEFWGWSNGSKRPVLPD